MTRTPTPWGTWEPASPAEVTEVFRGCQVPWRIAGGYAIELATGRPGGEHVDIDVLLLRRDRLAVQCAGHPVAGRACREDGDAGRAAQDEGAVQRIPSTGPGTDMTGRGICPEGKHRYVVTAWAREAKSLR
jgi:hypothetical protein